MQIGLFFKFDKVIFHKLAFQLCIWIVFGSASDKPHIRLAAAKSVLRLSRRWDLHVSPKTFCFTILMAKVCTL